jgi:hypothetical protein
LFICIERQGMGELHKLNEAGKYYKHFPNTSYVV